MSRPGLLAPTTSPADLLAPVKRWSLTRKFALCRAIHDGTVSLAAAKAAHGFSDEELQLWMAQYLGRGGKRALTVKGLLRKARAS